MKVAEIVDFHNALWASALSGTSGTALFWWWDRLDPRNHYPHYRPLADFVADIPWTTARLQPIKAVVSGPPARLVGLQAEDRAYLWLFDPQASWDNVVIRQHQPEHDCRLAGGDLTTEAGHVSRRSGGTRATGKVLLQQDVRLDESPLRLTPPPWHSDIACKITPTS